jgi:hypothetical protein
VEGEQAADTAVTMDQKEIAKDEKVVPCQFRSFSSVCLKPEIASPLQVTMSHDSEQEDLVPLHPGNMRAIPSTDARVRLTNLPKEQSGLNGLSATVLSQAAAKSSSGAIKVPALTSAAASTSPAPDSPHSCS